MKSVELVILMPQSRGGILERSQICYHATVFSTYKHNHKTIVLCRWDFELSSQESIFSWQVWGVLSCWFVLGKKEEKELVLIRKIPVKTVHAIFAEALLSLTRCTHIFLSSDEGSSKSVYWTLAELGKHTCTYAAVSLSLLSQSNYTSTNIVFRALFMNIRVHLSLVAAVFLCVVPQACCLWKQFWTTIVERGS